VLLLTVHAELLVGDAKSIYESGFRGLCFYTISHTQDELILKRTNKHDLSGHLGDGTNRLSYSCLLYRCQQTDHQHLRTAAYRNLPNGQPLQSLNTNI
jgi:hypothetical protein